MVWRHCRSTNKWTHHRDQDPGPSAFRGRRQRRFRDTKAEDPISKHREHILEQREKSSLDIFILSHQSYIQREILSKNSEVWVWSSEASSGTKSWFAAQVLSWFHCSGYPAKAHALSGAISFEFCPWSWEFGTLKEQGGYQIKSSRENGGDSRALPTLRMIEKELAVKRRRIKGINPHWSQEKGEFTKGGCGQTILLNSAEFKED